MAFTGHWIVKLGHSGVCSFGEHASVDWDECYKFLFGGETKLGASSYFY